MLIILMKMVIFVLKEKFTLEDMELLMSYINNNKLIRSSLLKMDGLKQVMLEKFCLRIKLCHLLIKRIIFLN